MNREPLLDLVAVSYQAKTEVGNFLASLAHLDVPYTLTVIDNASPDPGVRDVIRYAMPTPGSGLCVSSQYFFNNDNVGYARAINQGMTFRSAPYAAILNTDVEFLPSQSIAEMLEYMEFHPECGIIGPKTVDSSGRITHAGIITTPQNPHNHHRGWLHPDANSYRDTLQVNTVSGATYFVRRTMWGALTDCPLYRKAAPDAEGAFLPTRHFYEETFCSYHARHHKWTCVYYGRVTMIHQWHKSSTVGSQDTAMPRAQFIEACEIHGIDLSGEL